MQHCPKSGFKFAININRNIKMFVKGSTAAIGEIMLHLPGT